ncbi:MAG TPA: hypothetical protein VN704_04095, partial [Verrucomicrobiae bacterium]|nr:hypothetical protein [Verrucomicrobiae bacterium]
MKIIKSSFKTNNPNKACIFMILVQIVFLIYVPSKALADVMRYPTIRVAILDNLLNEKLSSDNYIDYYLSGIKAAKEFSRKERINIQYQTFFYDRTPLALLKLLPKVKVWHPDLIIGPRDSDNFLLLKNYFRDVLILSPYATSIDVEKMPNNFYSLTPSDVSSSRAILNIIENFFPKNDIFSITELDCKSCVDVSKIVLKMYEKNHPNVKIISTNFIGDEAEIININKLMHGYKKGEIILLPNKSVSSGILMMRITDYLKQDNTIFIGGDGWGSWKSGAPGRFKTSNNYVGFRVTPWSLDIKNKNFTQFKDFYVNRYHTLPPDHITYIIFTTILSVVAALKEYGFSSSKNMKIQILQNYKKALIKNSNWF